MFPTIRRKINLETHDAAVPIVAYDALERRGVQWQGSGLCMRVVNRWRLRFGVIIDHEARQKSSPVRPDKRESPWLETVALASCNILASS